MATTYRITIEKATDADSRQWTTEVVVVFDSIFTISDDVPEWIRAEVDSDARVFTEFPERPIVCQECADGEHEECPDNGLSAAPYWCICAAHRHELLTDRP